MFFFLLACHFLLFSSSAISNPLDISGQTINSLSFVEKRALKLFFHELFAENELGYTLFGDKPTSFCFPEGHAPYFSKKTQLYWIYSEDSLPHFKGLAVWKKLREFIQLSQNYSFVIYEEKKYPSLVIIINKKAFINEVNKNIDAFQAVYGHSITSAQILKNIEDKIFDREELFNQHLLLGIMLGYGRHSAELFQRRWSLEHREDNISFNQNKISPRDGFSSIKEELEYLVDLLEMKSEKFDWYTITWPPFLRVIPVTFAFDPNDSEAQSLIAKYKAQHKLLTSIFDKEDWLEKILNQLTNNDSM